MNDDSAGTMAALVAHSHKACAHTETELKLQGKRIFLQILGIVSRYRHSIRYRLRVNQLLTLLAAPTVNLKYIATYSTGDPLKRFKGRQAEIAVAGNGRVRLDQFGKFH